jgi:predicted nucleotide-binding protein
VALPLKTTVADVRDIVRYLKTKPTGASLTEAKAAVDKKLLDARKLSAYRTWGVLTRDEARLKLTDRGWTLARDEKKDQQMFREIIDSIPAYRSVLEWANHQKMGTLTAVDVGVHWHEHHRAVVGDANDNTLRENAVCFMNLFEAAGFGRLTIGRGGKPTRVDVALDVLAAHIEAGPTAPPWQSQEDVEQSAESAEADAEREPQAEDVAPPAAAPVAPGALRVFIAHGKNHEIVEQIETMLGLADFESEVAENEETTAIPVPDKVLDAMRRCQAGIIAVTVDEGRKDGDGNYVLNENVLIEIGAAFVLYERRVVLVWDKRLNVPSNLQGLYRCEFEGDELSWSAGMKLMKAIQGFKRSK